MKHLIKLAGLLLLVCLSSCDLFKPYSISYDLVGSGNTITISMPSPRYGITGIGSVDYGASLSDIERDIYNKLRSSHWYEVLHQTYSVKKVNVYLELTRKNEFGTTETQSPKHIGTIDMQDLRKYKEYKYYKGRISKMVSAGAKSSLKRLPN